MRLRVLGVAASVVLGLVAPRPAQAQEKSTAPIPLGDKDRIAPAPGAAVAKPMRPDWCANAPKLIDSDEWNEALYHDYQNIIHKMIGEFVGKLSAPYDELPSYALPGLRRAIAQAACAKPDDKDRQAWVATWRQAVLNVQPVTEAEDRALLAVLVASRGGRALQEAEEARCQKAHHGFLSSNRDPEFDRIWQVKSLAQDIVFGCAASDAGNRETLMWWVDRRALPETEIARTAFVLACLDKDTWSDGMLEYKLGEWVSCGVDAVGLDKDRFDADLKKLRADPEDAAIARARFAHARALGRAYQQRFEKLAKKQPALRAIAFDAPQAAFSAWEKLYAEHQALFDAVYQMEDTWSEKGTKPLRGSSGRLRAQLAAALKGKLGKSIPGAREVIAGPIGRSAMDMLVRLDYLDRNAGPATYFTPQLSALAPYRGPRTFAALAALDALARAQADDERFRLATIRPILPSSPLDPRPQDLQEQRGLGTQQGIVKSVKAAGAYVTVTFATESFMAPNIRCQESNRISHIDRDGHFVYKQDCQKVGTMKVVQTPVPVRLLAEHAKGLEAGMLVDMHLGAFGSPADGTEVMDALPLAVYADKKGTKLVAVWGMPL